MQERKQASTGVRVLNNLYNKWWIALNRLEDSTLEKEQILNPSEQKPEGTIYMAVWLLSLKKLMKTLMTTETNLNNFVFLDLGCGLGISLSYIAKNYTLKKVLGIEYEKQLLVSCQRNASKVAIGKNNIEIIHDDAFSTKLSHEKYIVFMFNPFSSKVLDSFLSNNLGGNIVRGSYFILANDHLLIQRLLEYTDTQVIFRDHKLNASVIRFG